VSTQYGRVTDERTDGQQCMASGGKNREKVKLYCCYEHTDVYTSRQQTNHPTGAVQTRSNIAPVFTRQWSSVLVLSELLHIGLRGFWSSTLASCQPSALPCTLPCHCHTGSAHNTSTIGRQAFLFLDWWSGTRILTTSKTYSAMH